MSFQLTPNISFQKETHSYGIAYVFRHSNMGELGRVVVQGHPDGQSHITCEVVSYIPSLSSILR